MPRRRPHQAAEASGRAPSPFAMQRERKQIRWKAGGNNQHYYALYNPAADDGRPQNVCAFAYPSSNLPKELYSALNLQSSHDRRVSARFIAKSQYIMKQGTFLDSQSEDEQGIKRLNKKIHIGREIFQLYELKALGEFKNDRWLGYYREAEQLVEFFIFFKHGELERGDILKRLGKIIQEEGKKKNLAGGRDGGEHEEIVVIPDIDDVSGPSQRLGDGNARARSANIKQLMRKVEETTAQLQRVRAESHAESKDHAGRIADLTAQLQRYQTELAQLREQHAAQQSWWSTRKGKYAAVGLGAVSLMSALTVGWWWAAAVGAGAVGLGRRMGGTPEGPMPLQPGFAGAENKPAAYADYEKALSYIDGNNFAQAVPLLLSAAERGCADAQFELAGLYYQGIEVPQNYAEAARWYLEAANQWHAKAQRNLGSMYVRGEVEGRPNFAAAARWYFEAAEQGDADAQVNLGSMYANGEIGTIKGQPDFAAAARLHFAAAEQGNAKGQYAFGVCCLNGQGVEKNQLEAAKLFGLAAGKGLQEAEDALKYMAHQLGQGRAQAELRKLEAQRRRGR